MTDEPCCPAERCVAQPRMIAYIRGVILAMRAAGLDLSETASSVLSPHRGYDRDRPFGTFGPTLEARWALALGEVRRELAKGGTDEEVALRLCPFALSNAAAEPCPDAEAAADPGPGWLATADAVARVGVTEATFYRLLREREDVTVRRVYPVGVRSTYWNADDLDALATIVNRANAAAGQAGMRSRWGRGEDDE